MNPRPPQRAAAPPGFSLIEVMLALGICTFSLTAVYSLIPLALRTSHQALETTRRAQIVEQVVNSLEQGSYASLQNASFSYAYDGSATNADHPAYYLVSVIAQNQTALPGTSSATTTNLTSLQLQVTTTAHSPTNTYIYLSGNMGQ